MGPFGHEKNNCEFFIIIEDNGPGIDQSIIKQLFKMREDPQKNLAVKLILNSAYGKKAESKNYQIALPPHLFPVFKGYFNSDRAYGRYTNFAEAGAITENVRLKLWRAAHKYGALMLATDGIITAAKIPAPGTLGEFEYKGEIKSGVILGCGRYELTYTNNKTETHLRGFSRAEDIFPKLRSHNKPVFSAPILDTLSIKEWNKSIDKTDFNVLTNCKKEITINDDKRYWQAGYFPKISDYFTGKIKSRPWEIRENENLNTARGSEPGRRRGQRQAAGAPGRAAGRKGCGTRRTPKPADGRRACAKENR
jgi:hypothetical protein